jgi:LacI family transcriptional regulator
MEKREANISLTFEDIARQAGVNLATIDHVLHNRAGVRPDTVRRVKEAIERNAFRPMSLRRNWPRASPAPM